MNIWIIQSGEPLPIENSVRRMRTALLAEKLLEREHTVCWWGSAFEHQRKIWVSDEDTDFNITPNFSIHVFRGCGYRKNISISRYIDHRLVALKFRLNSKKLRQPDIIVASMPCYHLAYEGMRFARRFGIPLLVDIRDLWPDTFIDSLRGRILPNLGRIALAFDFAKLSLLLREADGLVAMSNGCLEWGLNKIHKSPNEWDRVFYHGYKRNSRQYRNNNVAHFGELGKKKIFLFVGTFGNSYELRLIVEAAKLFYEEGKNEILFFLAGTGEQYESLRRETADLANVLLSGWIPAEDIRNLLASSWIGMVPCRSVKNAVPNKVFEYLSAGLPLISSLEGEMAELIDRHRIGLNYRPGDSEGLYQCIEILRKDSYLRDEMSLNALQFFNEFGDADKIYTEYAEHIERLVEERRGKLKVYQDETSF